MPNLSSYQRSGRKFWAVDVWVKTRAGSKRVRERNIPTKEMATARLAQIVSEAYQGRTFRMEEPETLTVSQAWENYVAISERDNDSWKSDRSRAAHLAQHLGKKVCAALNQGDVDAYRTLRLAELTKRGTPPAPASLDLEVELLKRVIGYAVRCGKLRANPLAGVALLRVPNVRDVTVTDEQFESIIGSLTKRSAWMRPILLVAFDTGMRVGEVCGLLAARVDWKAGCVRLTPQETKAERGRVVALQARTLAALKEMPRRLGCPYLFPTRRSYDPLKPKHAAIPRGGFAVALKAAGLPEVHLHDLRRSYATVARRRGVPESVVMAQGGWQTPSVFRRYNIVSEEDVLAAARTVEAGRETKEEKAEDGERERKKS